MLATACARRKEIGLVWFGGCRWRRPSPASMGVHIYVRAEASHDKRPGVCVRPSHLDAQQEARGQPQEAGDQRCSRNSAMRLNACSSSIRQAALSRVLPPAARDGGQSRIAPAQSASEIDTHVPNRADDLKVQVDEIHELPRFTFSAQAHPPRQMFREAAVSRTPEGLPRHGFRPC